MEFLNSNPLITAKPVVYLLNLSEKNFISKKSKWQRPVYEWVQVRFVPLCRPSSTRLSSTESRLVRVHLRR